VQALSASYTPGVRMMMLTLLAGIVVAWPLARLSGPARPWPMRQSLLDLVVLLCLAQVVVWPLRLVTTWPPERSALIDLCLCGWGAAAAAVVATGTIPARRGSGALRTVSMLVALALFAAMPLLTLLGGGQLPLTAHPSPAENPAWWSVAAASPLTAIDAITAAGSVVPGGIEWRAARAGWWAAIALWGVAVICGMTVPRVDDPQGPLETSDDDAESARVPIAAHHVGASDVVAGPAAATDPESRDQGAGSDR